MENTNEKTITIKNGNATISVPKNTEGFKGMVTTSMSALLGKVVLVAADGYCFECCGHTAYASSQEKVDKLLKQIHQCHCRECSDFRMQSDIRKRQTLKS